MKYCITVLLVLLMGVKPASAQNDLYPQIKAWQELKGNGWKGITKTKNDTVLKTMGTAIYTVTGGSKGWYTRGLMQEYDGVIDARQWFGISLEVCLQTDEAFNISLTVNIPKQADRHNLLDSSSATVEIQGKGWHTLTVPFSSFDYKNGQVYFLKFVKQISLRVKHVNSGEVTSVAFRHVKLIKGDPLYMDARIRSKPGDADSTVRYQVLLGNSSYRTQQVNLFFNRKGWEGMKATVEPRLVNLKPGEEKLINVSVHIPAMAPQGAQEISTLIASISTGQSVNLDLITVCRLSGPYLVHTQQEWQDVVEKTKKYDWARKELNEYIRKADEFEVPETPEGNLKTAEGTPAVYKSYLEQRFWPVAIAYKLTGQKKYAEKLALLLCRLSAPSAYPTTLHANSQGIPQEGGFWEGIARSFDIIKEAGVLSSADKKLIEQSLRLYIYTIEDAMGDGGISNWSVFNLCPAAQCALAIQDMYHFNYLMNGPCGVKDHMRYGLMDDGWWYEVSLSYNIGCVENMTALGLAAKPFGIDFLNEKISASLTQDVGLRPFEYEGYLGMAFGKFGPIKRNYVTVKDMWDAITVYPDYRGIMFGMGDGHEQKVGSGPFELAYFAFRDSAYAAVLKQADNRDLVYGIPQLPDNTPKLYTRSAHSDNAGVAVLRSQTPGRGQREQIQAALKYGTHGSYHGHFDKVSLLSLMRYGRSFWNPETSWFGYGSYMYKWWVQSSMASNMVVVDGKMQEPKETNPLLFHSGKMMQIMAIETKARWSNPPYLGGYDQIEKIKAGDAPYVPLPPNHPKVADVTDYTEPVTQRRLMIVTDDYVLLADYLKATKSHIFDNLVHLRGAKADVGMRYIGHDNQFDNNPLSSGQFITNVSNYTVNGVGKVLSTLQTNADLNWETGGFNGYQEPGVLNIDVYNIWPQKTTLRIGNYAESYNTNKKIAYQVKGDQKILATDTLGTWILGKRNIDVSVKDIRTLELGIRVLKGAKQNTLFWAAPKIITSKGKVLSLSQLKKVSVNIIPTEAVGKDYKGGAITIGGANYADALAAEPLKTDESGTITVDLSGLDAVRFVTDVGGDSPVGDENQIRKTVSFRTNGKEASYLSLLEPYEDKSMISGITSTDGKTVLIKLKDGRLQRISLEGIDSEDGKIVVKITEEKNGVVIRKEKSDNVTKP